MGETRRRRPKGDGGLFIIRKQAWNEFKQTYEVVDFYRATKEVENPEDPLKRKTLTGTGRSPQEAKLRLNRSMERFLRNKHLTQAGAVLKTRSKASQRLSEYFQEWYSQIRPNSVSQTLLLKYKQHFENHILPELGNVYLEDINYQMLQKLFYETLPAKKKIKAGEVLNQPLLSSNTLLNIYRTLNVALNVAVKMGKIPRNPLALVDTPKFVAPKENIPQLSHIATHMFKKMAEAKDPMWEHFVLAFMGLRKAERLGLTFSALTLTGDNPKIIIRSQLQRVSGQGLVLKQSTKSGKDRSVTIHEPFLSSLKLMKEVRKEQLKLPGFQPEEQFKDLVYLKDNGKPYDPNEDNELWIKVNQTYNAKKPKIRQHAMRHIAATTMADKGIGREVAMSLLGHQSISISHYYGRMGARGQREEVQKYAEELAKLITSKQ
jgi:integrase